MSNCGLETNVERVLRYFENKGISLADRVDNSLYHTRQICWGDISLNIVLKH